MNYYYDIILNWNEKIDYKFYEWNDNDSLELIKRIPIFKVKHKTYLDIIENIFKINNDTLEKIKDKTLISAKTTITKIEYACLITDGKNIIALEFNQDGLNTNRSSLLLFDELNALEYSYSLKEQDLDYEILEKISSPLELRQILETKKIINLELQNLYYKQDISKLKYLYYEYKHVECEDIELIYNTITKDLEKGFNEEFLKLYNIIKLSYHNV